VFLVEKGKVTDPVMNFRWNEAPVRVIAEHDDAGCAGAKTQGAEAGSSLAPAILATDFNFTSTSDAV
jgi:hypothetical protein